MQNITVLGSTGSIGVNTLDVVARYPERFKVFALTANTQLEKIFQQCVQFRPEFVVVTSSRDESLLQEKLNVAGISTQVLSGTNSLEYVASHANTDVVMAAIVGAAGLRPALAAAEAGKKLLLANKESLVMAGQLFMDVIRKSGALLLPIDSEHNAIFQCLPHDMKDTLSGSGIRKILLTASGGPFRTYTAEQLQKVTPEQACAHPNWVMGRKISVDSASLMNKGLELIEACWLFDTTPDHIEVVIHPQSIIHSMVQYDDGSTIAQLGNPDMRTPIAYGLNWPERLPSGAEHLDIFSVARMDFHKPDQKLFPCLRLAREAFDEGKTAPAVLNAANEVAVEAFLNGEIAFSSIPVIIEKVLEKALFAEPASLDIVLAADQQAREIALEQF